MRKVGQTSEFPFGIYWWTRKSQKNQTFEKMKKFAGDIIILHKCIKNRGHMLYCSTDMVCEECNCYFSFWAIFCLFTPLTAQKMKTSKQWKRKEKYLEISFYTRVPHDHDHMLCRSLDMVHDICNYFFYFFFPFTPLRD